MRLSIKEKILLLNTMAEESWLIDIPHRLILQFAIGIWSIEFLLLAFTTLYSAIVTIPIILFWLFSVNWYVRVWKSLRYSCVYIVILTVSVALAAFLSGKAIRLHAALALRYLVKAAVDLIQQI